MRVFELDSGSDFWQSVFLFSAKGRSIQAVRDRSGQKIDLLQRRSILLSCFVLVKCWGWIRSIPLGMVIDQSEDRSVVVEDRSGVIDSGSPDRSVSQYLNRGLN